MKIGILREFCGRSALGGAEFSVIALAEAFEPFHDVAIIHDNPELTRENVRELFGVDLPRTRFLLQQNRPIPQSRTVSPWRAYRESRLWNKEVSAGFDLFFNFCHGLPFFCHARLGMLIILFPLFDRRDCWWWQEPRSRRPWWLRRSRDFFYQWMWRRRFGSYRRIVAISNFTSNWAKRWWGVNPDVIYPPVAVRSVPREKCPLILSVGRLGPIKKQLDLVEAFVAMQPRGLAGWTFRCVGGSANGPGDREYVESLRRAAANSGAEVAVNLNRAELDEQLGSASIFWHAMGFGEDEQSNPLAMEHFGIVTVEAMAWGCVPVVIDRGGQPEIVRHGIDGFLWNTLAELEHYTVLLARDAALRDRMSKSARERAGCFSKRRFAVEVAGRCGVMLDEAPRVGTVLSGPRCDPPRGPDSNSLMLQ